MKTIYFSSLIIIFLIFIINLVFIIIFFTIIFAWVFIIKLLNLIFIINKFKILIFIFIMLIISPLSKSNHLFLHQKLIFFINVLHLTFFLLII